MKRVIIRKLVMGVGDGVMEADGKPIYEAEDLRVGLFDAKDLSLTGIGKRSMRRVAVTGSASSPRSATTPRR